MPVGPLINATATLIGGLVGASLGRFIPDILKRKLPLTFGLVAFSLGIKMVIGMYNKTGVVLALLIGVIIGEMLQIERIIKNIATKAKKPLARISKANSSDTDDTMNELITVIVLFCASAFGIIGAMSESMSGDPSMLVLKSILDGVTAAIFGASLGIMVAFIAIPQLIVLLLMFTIGRFILPLTTPLLIQDFEALGGIILIATGFNLLQIRSFSVSNMLPGLVLVMPLCALLG